MYLVAFRFLSMSNVQVLYEFRRVSVYMFKDTFLLPFFFLGGGGGGGGGGGRGIRV